MGKKTKRDKMTKMPDRIGKKLLKKYKQGRGSKLQMDGIKTKFKKIEYGKKEQNISFAIKQSARSELLLTEDKGYVCQGKKETKFFTQKELISQVDITTATKHFNLKLYDFGPYTIDYTRNGRHLLLGGKKGHVAAFDWMTKHLKCEINVMEEVVDVCWLHQETMFAVAQKDWVYMYDNEGIELHCLKQLYRILRMEFLPYHFLLASSSEKGFLSWLDISVGKIVSQFPTRKGRLDVMCQNPYNALITLGHSNGVVSMWSPNVKEALLTMLCHKNSIRAVAIDSTGKYMATGAVDRSLKIWDLRNSHQCLQSYKIGGGPSNIVFSNTGLLATSSGNIVEVYKDSCIKAVDKPIMRHCEHDSIKRIKFCPYEDVLGIGHLGGFTSIIVPGAGEANYDALESNPFQTKSQRREAEVKALLGKLPFEMITLDPTKITQVDVATLKDKIGEKKSIKFVKPAQVDFKHLRNTRWNKGKRNAKNI